MASRTVDLDRRTMVLGGVMLAGGLLAMSRQPKSLARRIKTPELETLIPDRVGDWTYQSSSGLVLPPADELSDRLYDGLVTKTFVAPGLPSIMLLIAYSNLQDGMLQVHRPEVCYPAGGYRVSETQHVAIRNGLGGSIDANAFSAVGESRSEQVLYWTRIGDRFPVRWADQRLAVVEANLAGLIPDGALVRISSIDPDLSRALPQLSAFAAELLQHTGRAGRKLLIGGGYV